MKGKLTFAFSLIMWLMNVTDGGRPVLKPSETKIYDQFGDETTLLYDQSEIEISCECDEHDVNSSIVQLINDKSVSLSEKICADEVLFQLPINNSTTLGEYKCRLKTANESSTADFYLGYRPCAADACDSKFCDGGEFAFCAVTNTNPAKNCNISKKECYTHQYTRRHVCPDKIDKKSHCQAMAEKTPPALFATAYGVNCTTKNFTLSWPNMAEYLMGAHINLTEPSFAFSSLCSGSLNSSSIDCKAKDIGKDVTLWKSQPNSVCGQTMTVTLNKSGSFLSKLVCNIAKSNGELYSTFVFLVVFDLKISITESPDTGSLMCSFQNPPQNSYSFISHFEWLFNESYMKNNSHTITNIRVGSYTCKAIVKFRSCSPVISFDSSSSLSYNFTGFTSSSSTSSYSSPETTVISTNIMLYLIIGSIVLLLVCLVSTIACVALWGYHRKINRKLEALGKLESVQVVEIAYLNKLALELANNKSKSEKLLVAEVGTHKDDKLEQIPSSCSCMDKVVMITSCRNPEIPCLTKSLVPVPGTTFRMHINKLLDYYNKPIYICQAPVDYEFPSIWKVIEHYKIGTIVWLHIPDKEVESYAKLSSGTREVGDYRITCGIATRSTTCDDYLLDVSSCPTLPVKFEPFSVVLEIANMWKGFVTPKDLTSQCDTVSFAQCHQNYMDKTGRPGLLIHNIDGVNITAGFVATYLGRQMLLDQRRVNITGICKYIREHRHMAFTYEKDSAEQLQVVFMVLGTFAKMFAKVPAKTREPSQQEKDKYAKHVKLTDFNDGVPGNVTCLAAVNCASMFGREINKSPKKSSIVSTVSSSSTRKRAAKGKQTLLYPSFVKKAKFRR